MEDNKVPTRKKESELSNPDSFVQTTILEFLGVIVRWKRFLLFTILGTTIIPGVVTFFLPRWYKATASVFPAEQTNLFAGLEGVSSLVKSFGGGKALSSLSGSSETDRYMAILKSDNALWNVIQKFDLIKVYDITSYPHEKTIEELLSNVEFDVRDEGNLDIAVYDKDPKRAADMANYFVTILNNINSEMHAQNAKSSREFIEQRYNKNVEDLHSAEEFLKSFQLKHGVIALPEQVEASIKAGAEISTQLNVKEIELNVLKQTLSPDHPGVRSAEIEIQEIKKQLQMMNSGDGLQGDQMKILVPFRQAPELGLEYLRLYRNAEIQYKILQYITPIYEQAKVEEKRSTPSVIILDNASVPERKAKPRISLYLLLAFVLSTIVAFTVIFTVEGIGMVQDSDPVRFAAVISGFGLRPGLFRKSGSK
ncbi:MAG: GumC family protein [Bacteroidota bacterium]